MSSSCATSSFHLKTNIIVGCFGVSISNFPSAAAWDNSSALQIIAWKWSDTAGCQYCHPSSPERGLWREGVTFLQAVTGQHQLGGCDALPLFLLTAEVLVVPVCWLAFARAAPCLAVWGRGPLSERLLQLVFFIVNIMVWLAGAHWLRFSIIMVLVGLAGRAAASITEFHKVALQQQSPT